MNPLATYIRSFVDFPDDELEEVLAHFQPRTLPKGAYLCRQGQVCGEISFIQRGFLRSFYLIHDQDVTRFILTKGVFATALTSFVTQTPSSENLQAITNTELWTISHRDLYRLYDRFPRMERLGRLAIERSHILLEERVLTLLSLTAEERYRNLSDERPELLQEVPLHYIASLLGVKPETLSRIRKKLSL
ncbi:Crp/Fnr family transcriptional regulator [Pontibacter sp. G13]|uniref:Crp/Fnr family transcriptional regulator n=1 Tax=Pontibacter sp. G13 TaxID=3074898 RepID=UPI00288AB0CE|nr:Crp/Fnr family transcriptional regulator [Pontibacter sp. G13]WNJ16857.1 Crp/Fnr family transcriptional regulator [Pontibacter sp. G13]